MLLNTIRNLRFDGNMHALKDKIKQNTDFSFRIYWPTVGHC